MTLPVVSRQAISTGLVLHRVECQGICMSTKSLAVQTASAKRVQMLMLDNRWTGGRRTRGRGEIGWDNRRIGSSYAYKGVGGT